MVMAVRVARITDNMTTDDKILELLVCMRTNLFEMGNIKDKTDYTSVRSKMALQLQLEAQVSRAIMYASKDDA
jgi:hypothetical protein